ncbi:hypothetical protein M1403_02510 [Patescibacteria group bacterium]|nr:hypothetical protein [Patescibacteria group bacterium]
MQDDIFQKFIDKVKADKNPEEAEKFFQDFLNFSAAELYVVIMSQMTEEDMQAIEKISDDALAEEEIKKRFKDHTQMTPEEFLIKLRDRVSQQYLTPGKN